LVELKEWIDDQVMSLSWSDKSREWKLRLENAEEVD
jgi:hypothetical protein